eukprot:14762616-Heterocapsa_arctica.AAC.1
MTKSTLIFNFNRSSQNCTHLGTAMTRKAKQRAGTYSQYEDQVKRFRATDLEKTEASDSGVVSIPVEVLQTSPDSLKRPASASP